MTKQWLIRGVAVVTCCILAACASSDPGSVSLNAQSGSGVVLFDVVPVSVQYTLWVDSYNEKNETTEATAVSGSRSFKIAPGQRFAAATLAPGTYVLYSLDQQSLWRACYHASTVAFDVRAGEVLYVGIFDPSETLRNISFRADLVSRNREVFHYLDGIPTPWFELRGGAERARVFAENYVRTSMPNVQAPVRTAQLRRVRFPTGYSLLGSPICGGYAKEKPKPR